MIDSLENQRYILGSKGIGGRVFNGTVVDVEDPMRLGRVRVSIENLTAGVGVDMLPWYSVVRGVSSSPNAGVCVPPLGSDVVVRFDSDIYNGWVSFALVSKPPDVV